MESEEDRCAAYGASPGQEEGVPEEPINRRGSVDARDESPRRLVNEDEEREYGDAGSPHWEDDDEPRPRKNSSEDHGDVPHSKRRRSHEGQGSGYEDSRGGPSESRRHPTSRSEGGESMSLLVRRLKFATSPATVRKYFEQCGEVKDVYLPLDYERGNPRGFGFVEFADARDAETALRELNDTELDGSRISISVAQHGRKTPSTMRQRSAGNRRRFRRDAPYADDRSGSPYRSRSSRGYRDYGPPPSRGYDNYRPTEEQPPRGRYSGSGDYDRYRDSAYGPPQRNWDYRGEPRGGGSSEMPAPRSSYSGRRGSR